MSEKSEICKSSLTPKQHHAAVLAFTGTKGVEIARILEVSVATVSAWHQMPDFQIAISALTERLAGESIEAMLDMRNSGLKRLRDIAENGPAGQAMPAISLILKITEHLASGGRFPLMDESMKGKDPFAI